MKRFLSGFLVVINFVVVFAQQDSIYIEAKVSNDKKQMLKAFGENLMNRNV